MPPITPKNSISKGTLVLNGESASPIEATMLPEIHIGLNPNLLTSPPIIGPNIDMIPLESELTNDTVNLFDSKLSIKGCKSTPPNVNPKPSEMSNGERHVTQEHNSF